MANTPIAQALQGVEGFRGTGLQEKGRIDRVGPAHHEARRGNSGLGDAMRQLVQGGADAYGAYKAGEKSKAEERSNEIIRKLTPEQRRQAIADGTLLYQDDADAMTLLRQKTGRNAAFEVDSEIQQKIQQGIFRTRKDMEEYRQQRLQDRAIAYAKDAGIDPEDVDYKRGFDADITTRNAGLYDLQNQFLSKNLEAQAAIEARNDLTPLMADPTFLGSKDGGYVVSNYIARGLESGEIPSDREAINTATMLATDAISKDGGANFLRAFKDQKIKVYGAETTIENLLGPEVYQNMITKADTATYERNAKKTETFQLGLANAVAQVDSAAGWQMINKLEQENDWVQQGDQMTPQRQALIQAKAQLIARVQQDTATAAKGLEKRAQADNRINVIDEAYSRRINGENISVDPKFLPVDENTGEFKESDMASFAAKKLNQIDQMGIPDDQKDTMKLALLQADYAKGPFQAAFGTLIQDASREWQGAIATGQVGDFKRIQELQRAYASNPGLLAQLYPESAGLMETFNLMGEQGIDPQVMVDAAKARQGLSMDESRFRDEQWASVKNNSKAPELKYIPNGMEQMARSVYDANTLRTGDPNAAADAVTQFLQKNTVTFTEGGSWKLGDTRSFHGMLSKADLQTDPSNVKSWEEGKAIIDETVQQLSKDSVWGTSGMSITAAGGVITIQSLNGQRIQINKDQFQAIAEGRRKAATAEAETKARTETQRTQKQYDKFMRGGA